MKHRHAWRERGRTRNAFIKKHNVYLMKQKRLAINFRLKNVMTGNDTELNGTESFPRLNDTSIKW
jgi:hypothetical protein